MSSTRPEPGALLRECLEAIRHASDPEAITREALSAAPASGWLTEAPDAILAIGKASAAMARAALDCLGSPPRGGLVIAPPGVAAAGGAIGALEVLPADHPLPTERNLEAARRAARLVETLPAGARLLCLISGGGSAHLAKPAPEIALEDLSAVASAMMRAGAGIREVNAIRKHCETLKGGGLARRALLAGATVYGLILSDVVGDPLDVIASGPLSPDSSTFDDALQALDHRGCRDASEAVTRRLEAGARRELPETLKHDDPLLMEARDRLRVAVIANHTRPARAAADVCRKAGLRVDLQTDIEAPAAEVGRQLAAAVLRAGPGVAVIRAGEWTVDARNAPKEASGGPSQELALAAAIEFAGRPAHVLAYSTDGVDGPTDAAGAIIDSHTCARGRERGVDCAAALRQHDSFGALSKLGATIPGGATGTNLNHVAVAMLKGS